MAEGVADGRNDVIRFLDVENEAQLVPKHDEMPIYIPRMKCTLSMGHFIVIGTNTSDLCVVGQILGRSYDCDHPHLYIDICCYLPLYCNEVKQYLNNPSILPVRICSSVCLNVMELVNISRIAKVKIASIKGLAFVFLESEVNSYLYYIQGMKNAFIVRFKYCATGKVLTPLDNSSFHCFPDLHPVHRMAWDECYGRTIYLSIDNLRQEIWRFLCRYGDSQGLFPRQLIHLNYPCQFTNYLCNFLVSAQVPFALKTLREPHRRVETGFMYRTVSASQQYKCFNLDSAEAIEVFSGLLGATFLFGIWKRKPKLGSEISTKMLDAINVLSRLELYVSYSSLKVRLYAYKHVVGADATQHRRLLEELGGTQQGTNANVVGQQNADRGANVISSLRVNSKFDYNGNLFKVVSVSHDGNVLTTCLWGPQSGENITFHSVEEVARLVNLKRGQL